MSFELLYFNGSESHLRRLLKNIGNLLNLSMVISRKNINIDKTYPNISVIKTPLRSSTDNCLSVCLSRLSGAWNKYFKEVIKHSSANIFLYKPEAQI